MEIPDSVKGDILALEGVHRVGERRIDGEWSLVAHVDADEFGQQLPRQVDGHSIVYMVDGRVQPLWAAESDAVQTAKTKRRPVPPGVSVSLHPDEVGNGVATGTTGFFLTDGNKTYLTSNNHVLGEQASLRSDVIQPGAADTTAREVCARFTNHVRFPDENLDTSPVSVDIAWAEPEVEITASLPGLGRYSADPVDPVDGDEVKAATRGNGIIEGVVTEADVWGFFDWDGTTYAYKNAFTFDREAIPGDSGGPVVFDDGEPYTPAGMIFAAGGGETVCCTASNILQKTGFDLAIADEDEETPAPTNPVESGGGRAGQVLTLAFVALALYLALERKLG